MPFELVREYITLDQEVNSFNTQTSLEEIVKIPDYKPNMRSILYVDGEVNPYTKLIEGSTLTVEGDVNYKVYYVAEGGYLDCAEVAVPFDFTEELDDLEGDIESNIKAYLQHVDFRITNSRKLNIRSIMEIQGKLIKKSNFPLLVDVKEMENIQKLQDKINITRSATKENVEIILEDSVSIDEKDETALKLIDTSFRFTDLKSSKSPSGVLLTGKLLVDSIYSVDDEEGKEYKTVNHSISLSQFVEKTEVENIDDFFFDLRVNSHNIDFSSNPEEGQISLKYDIEVSADIIFYENMEIENIQDLYSPEVKSHIEKDEIMTYFLVDYFEENIKFQDELYLDAESPVQNLLVSNAKALITSIDREEDYLRFDGIIKASFIASEIEMMEEFSKDIPFTYTFEAKNCELFDNSAYIDELDVNFRGNSITIEGNVCIKGNLFEKIKLNLVKSVNEVEEEEVQEVGEYFTIKAHYKQPHETLWEIAKENRTTVEKILSDNNLESEENVEDFTPLMIFK